VLRQAIRCSRKAGTLSVSGVYDGLGTRSRCPPPASEPGGSRLQDLQREGGRSDQDRAGSGGLKGGGGTSGSSGRSVRAQDPRLLQGPGEEERTGEKVQQRREHPEEVP